MSRRRPSLSGQPPRAVRRRRAGFLLLLGVALVLALAPARSRAMPAPELGSASPDAVDDLPALLAAEPPPTVSVLPGWWVASEKPASALAGYTIAPTLWAGTSNAAVWLYTDDGWVHKSNGMGNVKVRRIQMNPFDEDVLLAVTSDGMYRTADGGDNWSHITMPYTQADWRCVYWDRSNPGVVFAAGPRVDHYPRAARSTDGGETWTGIILPHNLDWVNISDIWGNGQRWYMMGATLNTLYDDYYFISHDGGITWARTGKYSNQIGLGLTTEKYITGHDQDPNYIYATGYHNLVKIRRSTDGGANWSGEAAGSYNNDLLYDHTRPNTLWLAASHSLQHSQDDGATFTITLEHDDEDHLCPQYDPQHECLLNAVAVDGYSGRVCVGANNRAVACSADGVTNWITMAIPLSGTLVTADTHVNTIESPRPNPFLWDQSFAPIECPFGSSTAVNDWLDGAINTRMGNYHYGQQDISIPTIGGPLYFERSYNANATAIYTGSLNYGWTHNYDVQLIFSDTLGGAPGIVTVQGCRGSRFRFNDNDDGTHTPFPGVWATLTRTLTSPYTYTLTGVDQSVYLFDDAGQLAEMRSPQGQAITLVYTSTLLGAGSGTQLARVEDPSGERFLAFAYDDQERLAEVRDPISRTVTYGYNGAGNLTVVTDTRGLAWTYTYTSTGLSAGSNTHLLYEVRDPAGDVVERTEYDDGGRVVRRWDGTLGQPLQIGYGISGTTTITDGNGHVTSDRYDGQGTLVWQSNPYGSSERSYDFYFNWSSTTDPNDNTTGYVFNQMGRPEVISDALDGVTRMTYDDRDHLTELTDAADHPTHYEYDGNLLITTTDALSGTVVNSYDERGLLIQTVNHGVTTTYGYDGFGQRVAMTDALSHVTTYGYDAVGRLVTTTNPAGQATVNEYDAGDNLVRVTRNYTTTTAEQNYLNAYNLVTEYGYDQVGHRVATTDTLSHVTRSWYDAAGRLISSTANYSPTVGQNYQNQWNLTTWYGYDGVGNQILVTDTLGSVTFTEYDELNRVARTWQNYLPGYPQNWQEQYNIVTEYGYDAVGNQTLVTDTLAHVTFTEYDALNRPVTVTTNYVDSVYDPARPDQDLWTVTLYDEVGNAVQVTDHASRFTRYEYDALSRLITTTDALSGTTVNAYDAAGKRVAVTDAEGRVTRYEYDALGRVVTATDALSGTTIAEYDALGRRIRTQDAGGRITRYEYDAAGRLVTTTNALSGTTAVHYDPLGRRTQVTDAESRTTHYGYDALGRTVAMTDAIGAVTRYGYDALGRQVVVTDATGIATYLSYDSLGRLVGTRDALSNTTQYGYDALSNRVVMTAPQSAASANGIATHYEYDGVGRLVAVVENYTGGEQTPDRDVRTGYGYDGLGNRTVVSDANGHATHYAYDALNRLAAETDPLTHTTAYGYDRVGNRSVMTDADGGVTVYAYDALNRLTNIQYPISNVQYAYDAVGNRVAMTDSTGSTTYVYDALYRPITITAPASGTVGYRYDAVGNRTRLLYPGGQEVIYTYDGAHRLWKVEDWQNRVVRYRYDAAGRVLTVTRPGGLTPVQPLSLVEPGAGTGLALPGTSQVTATAVVTCVPLSGVRTVYRYDEAGRLAEMEHERGTRLLGRYEYTLDGVGNRTAVTETLRGLSGAPVSTVITYTYDGLSRLVGAAYSSGEAFEYGYDPVGNRTVHSATITTTLITTYTYDAANRLTWANDVGYTWDDRGNLLAAGPDSYGYDGAGRMITASVGGVPIEYVYNGDGLRTVQSVDGVETAFTWDLASPLAHVISDTDALYLHGLDLLAQQRGNAQRYYLGDGLGSVRQMVNRSGTVKQRYDYTPFGVALASQGSVVNAFQYTGEWWDAAVGLQYLRARWYAPYLNQFVSPDPIVPDFRNPPSIHRYLYALANPINHTDPSGHTPRPPGVCPAPTENPRHMPDYVFAPSFLDWANGNQAWWSGSGIGHPVWLYCGDFYATAYQFVTEANSSGKSWYADTGGTDEAVTLSNGTTFIANSLFVEDVRTNGTGKPSSAACPESDYFHIWNGVHCGKGRPFDPDAHAYKMVAADPTYLQSNAKIYIPELEYGPALQSWGNAEFTVADTGDLIQDNRIDVFVGEGPGLLSRHYNDCPTSLYTHYQNSLNEVPETTCSGRNCLGPVAVYQRTTWPYIDPCGFGYVWPAP